MAISVFPISGLKVEHQFRGTRKIQPPEVVTARQHFFDPQSCRTLFNRLVQYIGEKRIPEIHVLGFAAIPGLAVMLVLRFIKPLGKGSRAHEYFIRQAEIPLPLKNPEKMLKLGIVRRAPGQHVFADSPASAAEDAAPELKPAAAPDCSFLNVV